MTTLILYNMSWEVNVLRFPSVFLSFPSLGAKILNSAEK